MCKSVCLFQISLNYESTHLKKTYLQIQNKNSATASDLSQEPAYAKPMKSRSAGSSNPTSPNNESQVLLAQGENGQLESMLGDLQSDMNKQGVNTKQKGVCAACNKPIVGQVKGFLS